MYYEARIHYLVPVASAAEAAARIRSGTLSSCQVPVWEHRGFRVLAVNDNHPDDAGAFQETALIRQEGEAFFQVESISARRVSLEELVTMFEKYALEPTVCTQVDLIIGRPKGEETVWFDCGCCGSGFRGNVKYQLQFDQDAGYGICSSCEGHYK